MKIALNYNGQERELEVPSGVSIAQAALDERLNMMGSCGGGGICCQCVRYVRTGIDKLMNVDGTPYKHRRGTAPFVKTCEVTPKEDGVSIDADMGGRK